MLSDYSPLIFVFLSVFLIAKGIKPCQQVYPPGQGELAENCSIICGFHLLNYITNGGRDDEDNSESPLCNANLSAITCTSHEECRIYYVGALCKKIPCACQGKSGSHFFYMPSPKLQNQIQSWKACTVSLKWMNPDEPLVPFPWKTLLVVFAIVASFAICLLAFRWLTPFIRAMQAKRERNHPISSATEEEEQPFSSTSLRENTHLSRLVVHSTGSTTNSNQVFTSSRRRFMHNHPLGFVACSIWTPDKPPPYELAVQEPPSYEEHELRQLNSPDESCSVNTRDSLCEDSGTVQVPEFIDIKVIISHTSFP